MKIIKIGAVWCGSCIAMKNRWKDIEKEYDVDVTNYDYDFDEEKVKEYNIGSILPVAIFLDDNNNVITRLVGEKNKEDIIRILKEYK